MRGRDVFRRVEPLLNVGASILKLLPHRLVVATWWLVEWIPGHVGLGIRYMYAKRLCRACGQNVKIDRRVDIRYWDRLSLGNNVSLHELVYLDANGGVTIHDDTTIAHMASILAFEHTWWEDPTQSWKDQPLKPQEVVIGPDAMIGAGVRVLGGVTVGERVAVGANAVVAKTLTAPGLYGGIPARLLRAVPPRPAPASPSA